MQQSPASVRNCQVVWLTSGLMLATATAAASTESDQYLCVVEQAAGLHYDNQAHIWRPQAFGSRKYILRKLTEDNRDHQRKWSSMYDNLPKVNWAFFYFGDDFPNQRCVEGEPFPSRLTCIPSASFDKETLRFEIINHGSYIDQGFWEQEHRKYPKANLPVDPTHPDDLGIEIGRCSPNSGAPPPVLLPDGASAEPKSTENATDVCARRCLPPGGLPKPTGIGAYISRLSPSTEATS
jgi:hypothetical protein